MTDAAAWHPEQPHNQLPALPPAHELESRTVLKACIEARAALAELKQAAECWRRFKIEPPCRLNFEPGLMANL